jgi:hypothetical protein
MIILLGDVDARRSGKIYASGKSLVVPLTTPRERPSLRKTLGDAGASGT